MNNAQKINDYKNKLNALQQEHQAKLVEHGVLQQTIGQQKEYFQTNFGTTDVEVLDNRMVKLQGEIAQLENDLALLG